MARERAVLPPDDSEAAVDLAFEPSYEVSGWVSGPAGEPVADAYIRSSRPAERAAAPTGGRRARSISAWGTAPIGLSRGGKAICGPRTRSPWPSKALPSRVSTCVSTKRRLCGQGSNYATSLCSFPPSDVALALVDVSRGEGTELVGSIVVDGVGDRPPPTERLSAPDLKPPRAKRRGRQALLVSG
jgi:hypothetical protein